MARIPEEPSQDQQIRHMQEQIRRLWTRIPPTTGAVAVEAFQSLVPYLAPGWYDFDEAAGFYKDRERVYFRGVVAYNAAITGADASKLTTALPVGYRPTTYNVFSSLHTATNSTPTATKNHWWEIIVGWNGSNIAFLANPSFSGSPNFGNPPDGTVFDLEGLNFRIN